ncbi:MAG: hypothetical protein ACE5GJ_06790 [Gemmatimonadota bacterium]
MSRRASSLQEGLIVGLIGYAVVAVFYAVFDILAGKSAVFTLNLLGQMLFRGVRDPAVLQLPMAPDLWAMVGYNFVHLFVSLAVGIFVAWLVANVEERPHLGRPVLAVLIAGYVITVLVVAVFARDASQLMPLWTILVVNTLAALGGGAYLWKAHPGLAQKIRGNV